MPDFSGLPLVIESSDLLAQLDDEHLIVVDLTSAARYAEGHIPGAHFVDPTRTQLGQPPAPGLLPNKAELEKLLQEFKKEKMIKIKVQKPNKFIELKELSMRI